MKLLRSQTLLADPEGMPISVRSSSNWEAVTTPHTTFWGVALAARAAREGVEVPGGHILGVTLIIRANDQMGRQTSIARVHRLDLVLVP